MTSIAMVEAFTTTGQSSTFSRQGDFNISISGFGSATVKVERSFDGSTWKVIDSFTADAEKRATEPEAGIVWRFNCTSYTSGTIVCRFSAMR